MGTLLTVQACCDLIKAAVPDQDVNGNYIDCFIDPPVGSSSHPIDLNKVLMVVNSENKVVHPVKKYLLL